MDELTLAEYQAISPVFEEDINEAISVERCIEARSIPGGPAAEQVKEAIAKGRGKISEIRKCLS